MAIVDIMDIKVVKGFMGSIDITVSRGHCGHVGCKSIILFTETYAIHDPHLGLAFKFYKKS